MQGFTTRRVRWTGEEEKECAREIREDERKVRQALAGYEVAEEILRKRPRRKEQTRAGAVDRLKQALDACIEAAATSDDDAFKQDVRRAASAWAHAESLRWSLAMSGKRIAHGEARKLACALMGEEDLVQEGYVGLLRAAIRFDPDRGIRFSTYSRWWVRAQMTRALEMEGRIVRLPGGAVETLRNIWKQIKQFEDAGFYDWTDANLAEELGIAIDRVRLLRSQQGAMSVEEQDEMGLTLSKRLIVEGPRVDPEINVITQQLIDRVKELMEGDIFTEREQFVLVNRYQLAGAVLKPVGDRAEVTLSQIGKHMGLSRERIRQIELNAFQRVRLHGMSNLLPAPKRSSRLTHMLSAG